MTAFESAWDLVKMPIVPHSLIESEGDEWQQRYKQWAKHNAIPLENLFDFTHYSALFDDPKTGERLPMEAIVQPVDRGRQDNEQINALILEENRPLKYNRADAAFRKPTNESFFEPTMVGTDSDYRRRGYMTAIYDMVASILDRRGETLEPSDFQTQDAKNLWRSKTKKYGPSSWLVRDDL